MMNKNLLNIIKSREDISDYLFHFTKGNKAAEVLNEIITSNAILDVSNKGFICFTETPITLLNEMFEIFNKFYDPLYAPYGIAIKKDVLFHLGARPVIYGTNEEKNQLPMDWKWRFVEYIPNIKDYSWLREWRLKEKQIELNPNNCFIITKTKLELERILFNEENLIDIEFDGCVADGGFWGDATGIIGRAFKGISFEDIKELNTLSKLEINRIIDDQNMNDTIKMGLGAFGPDSFK